MAPHGWRKSPSVGAWLEEQGELFDFFQAIALLENEAVRVATVVGANPDEIASVGTGPAPHREVVKLRSSIAMSFPRADVMHVRRLPDGKRELTTRVMGLAGALGPLPAPYAELVARRAVHRDFGLRDFLDIFNHRLLSLFYRARKQHRISLGVGSPVESATARHLYSLIGLGTPGLHGRLGVPDRALLHYAGTLARPIRTMAGLEVLLRRHFGVPVQGKPLTGKLCPIEREDRTSIGRNGSRRALGRDAMIGERVWIQDAAFELEIGPLSAAWVDRFLPGGDAIRPLCALVEVVAGDVTSYSVRLLAQPGARVRAQLLSEKGLQTRKAKGKGAPGEKRTRLGYTTWLGARRGRHRKDEIILSAATLARFRGPAPETAQEEASQ